MVESMNEKDLYSVMAHVATVGNEDADKSRAINDDANKSRAIESTERGVGRVPILGVSELSSARTYFEKFLRISGISLITASLAERPTTSPKNKILNSFSP